MRPKAASHDEDHEVVDDPSARPKDLTMTVRLDSDALLAVFAEAARRRVSASAVVRKLIHEHQPPPSRRKKPR